MLVKEKVERNRPGYKQILANDIYNAQVLYSQATPPFVCHTLCSSDRVERRRREHSETANAHLRSLSQEEERELHHLAKASRERVDVVHRTQAILAVRSLKNARFPK
jgi:hypothetical protein